uniref:ELMO armadillo-like helical domain-containing protein n=1 Tax=Anopheles atroparvus TaxID=41427 RepID=A0AAG5DX44_ANOAO
MLPKHSKMPAIKDSHIVKIAVQFVNDATTQMLPQLIEFDQRQPLGAIIQNLCIPWGIPDAENYALQFDGINYVTEKNRHEVKNGTVLKLRYSPSKTTNDILEKLRRGTNEEKVIVLKELQVLSADNTFALEFIKEQGLSLLIDLIEESKCEDSILECALCSFVQLMEHGTISWDILEQSFIMHNVTFINGSSKKAEILQSSLSILENIVQSSNKYALVEKEITLETLLKLLRDALSTQVQQNAIALLNALFIKADDAKRRTLATTLGSKQYRSVINSVITPKMGAEMAHQLYVLQTLTLGLLEQRMKTPMDVQDQDAQEKIKELRRIAFEADGIDPMPDVTARRQHGSSYSSHYKKLGFKCDINPAQDFFETPPGTLAIYLCMLTEKCAAVLFPASNIISISS